MLGRFEHVAVGYCSDTSTFRPLPQAACRDIFKLPGERKLALLVAENLNDPRKGLDLVVNGLPSCSDDVGIELVVAGSGRLEVRGVKTHYVGAVHDPRLMAILYNAVDLAVVPSRQDNSPNVIIESLCCGTPVVCTAAGGMPELVCSPELGIVSSQCSPESLRESISISRTVAFNRDAIAAYAARAFSEDSVARKYAHIYNDAVERHRGYQNGLRTGVSSHQPLK